VDRAISALFKIGNDPVTVFETALAKGLKTLLSNGQRTAGDCSTRKKLRSFGPKILRFTEVVPDNVQRRLTAQHQTLAGGHPHLYGESADHLADFKTA
jgi:hypothetical protein